MSEKALSVRIGSVRAYGLKGVEVITCGGDPNEWMSHDPNPDLISNANPNINIKADSNADSSANPNPTGGAVSGVGANPFNEYAVDLSMIVSTTAITNPNPSPSPAVTISSRITNPASLSENNPLNAVSTHIKLELLASLVSVTWDSETIHILRTLSSRPVLGPIKLFRLGLMSGVRVRVMTN
jgi:hypothetical protein